MSENSMVGKAPRRADRRLGRRRVLQLGGAAACGGWLAGCATPGVLEVPGFDPDAPRGACPHGVPVQASLVQAHGLLRRA